MINLESNKVELELNFALQNQQAATSPVSGVSSYLGSSTPNVAIRFAALMSGFLVLHYKKDRRQDVVEVRSLNAGPDS